MNSMTVCPIILNYKSADETINLTISLLNNIPNTKVLIVDNNSPDSSYEVINSFFKGYNNVITIKTNKNGGYACGNNFGIRFALKEINPQYIMIINPDVELPPNFVESMICCLQKDPLLASVTGVMLSFEKHIHYSSIAWKLPTSFTDVILNVGLLRMMYNPITYCSLSDKSLYVDALYYVDVLPGSCFVIKSDVLNKINYFDEHTFLYCEERILAKKIKQINMKNGLSIHNYFIHKHNYKTRSLSEKSKHLLYLYKSRLYYNIKYTNYGSIFVPFFVLSSIIGFFEMFMLHIFYYKIYMWIKQ